MKYIIHNIKGMLFHHKCVFYVIVLGVMVSSIIIYFAYDSYVEYSFELKNADADDDALSLTFEDETVSKEQIELFFQKATDRITYDLTACAAEIYIGDKICFCNFEMEKGKFVYPEIFSKNLTDNFLLVSGQMYSKEQFQNGEKVILTNEQDGSQLGKQMQLWGELYQVIGTQRWCDYLLPITALPKSAKINELTLQFEKSMDRKQYRAIKELATEVFEENVTVPYMKTKDAELIHYYYRMLAVVIFVAMIAALNFIILYQYILMQRQKSLSIYRLCGMTRQKAGRMYIIECIWIIVPFHLIGFFVYRILLYPNIKKYWMYVDSTESTKMYVVIFVLYCMVSVAAMLVMLHQKLGKQIRYGGN